MSRTTKTFHLTLDFLIEMGLLNFALVNRQGGTLRNVTCQNRSNPRARSPLSGIVAGRQMPCRRQMFGNWRQLRKIKQRLSLWSDKPWKNLQGLMCRDRTPPVVLWQTCKNSVNAICIMCINTEALYLALFNQSRNVKTNNLFDRYLTWLFRKREVLGTMYFRRGVWISVNSNISVEGKN